MPARATIRRLLLLLLVSVVSTTAAHGEKKSYSGFSVYRGKPTDEQQVQALKELSSTSQLVRDGKIEFFRGPSLVHRPVDIMVEPNAEQQLKSELQAARVPHEKVVKDLEKVIKTTSVGKKRAGASSDHRAGDANEQQHLDPKVFHTRFHPFSTIEAKLKQLEKSDSRLKLETVGHSFEKRPLYLVKISSKPEANRSVVLIDAGHHAREWATHSSIMYIIESILGSSQLPTHAAFEQQARGAISLSSQLDKYDFHIMPNVNPDGYEYSRTSERLWRKNRSQNGSPCVGTDMNRNYGFMWTSSQQCDFMNSTWGGPKPLSEPETQAVASVIKTPGRHIAMYLTLHSYGAFILSPYGYGDPDPANLADLQRVADAGVRAMQPFRQIEYWNMKAFELYPAAGGSDDYAYEVGKIKLAFTIEIAECRLPAGNRTTFLLPPDQIVLTAQELSLGIAAMVNAIKN